MAWVDSGARPSKTKIQYDKTLTLAQLQTQVALLMPLLAAVSDSGERGASGTVNFVITPTAATAGDQTGTAMDKIIWVWRDADGNEYRWESPSPLPTQMLPNGITVDVTNASVANLIAYILAHAQSPYGKATIALVKAYRSWKNRKAKNI